MIYLSRLILNPRSRQVQSELARPYQMHKSISKAFPDVKFVENQPSGILFRIDEDPRSGLLMLLVQSQHQPNWEYLFAAKNYLLPIENLPPSMSKNPAVKAVNLQLRVGQTLSFRLHANPTKRLGKNAEKGAGKRVGLFKEKDQTEWLERKLEAAGAIPVQVNIAPQGNTYADQTKNGQKHKITLLGVRFEGLLRVSDPQKLIKTLNCGIGPAKAFGCGLLSLAPA